jgi:hypothetical protein
MAKLRRHLPLPPRTFWAYLVGTAAVVAVSLLPSSVHTTYSWDGAVLEAVLLIALAYGWSLSRWTLIALGLLAGFGSMALQSGSIDPVATATAVLTLAVTGLLFTPSMRRHTRRRDRLEPVAG